jgi:hypothetical protein
MNLLSVLCASLLMLTEAIDGFVVQPFARTIRKGPGGTANLAVLGGNLPPSRTHRQRSAFGEIVVRAAVGLVARQNGPVARSTGTASNRSG